MKFLILIAFVSIAVKASPLYPSNVAEDAYHYTTTTTDFNSPIRQRVRQYTRHYVAKINAIIRTVLKQFPKTEPYRNSRRVLRKFLQNNLLYTQELRNCIWNLKDLNDDFNEVLAYFTNPDASAHQRNVLRLLIENGLSDLKPEVGAAAWQFVNGEMGSTDDINDDSC